MKAIIEANNLTKLYKNNRGIKNISFTVDSGDILGLLGPNGSGKTTVMKILTGLLSYEGSVRIFNTNPETQFEQIMKNVGSLIEAPAIYKNLTAEENLMLTARMKGSSKADAISMLELVGLYSYKSEKAGKFSLGMKQRLGLAEAFIGNPKLIILDEPVNGLDIEGVVEVREAILRLNREYGTTFLISSHIASEIEKLCNNVAVLYESELIAYDSVENAASRYPSLEEYFLETIKRRRGVL